MRRMPTRKSSWSFLRPSFRTSSPTATRTPRDRWCIPSTARALHSLKHLVALLRDLKDPFVTIEFDQKGNEALVFSRAAIAASTDDILTDNGVRAQGSSNMMAVGRKRLESDPTVAMTNQRTQRFRGSVGGFAARRRIG